MFEFQNLFLSVNEADGVANFENSDVLKTHATEPTLYVNPNGVQSYEIDNLCNYDIIRMLSNCVTIVEDDFIRLRVHHTT